MEDIIEVRYNRIPAIVKWFFGIIYYIYAVYIAFLTLMLIVMLFNESWKTGLALFLTGIGEFIYIIPPAVAFGGLSIVSSWTEGVQNKWEFWIKTVIGYILAYVISYLLLALVSLLTGFIMAI